MINSSICNAPPALFVLAVICFLVTLLSRGLFLAEDPPAFTFNGGGKFFVMVEGPGFEAGIRQFSDDYSLSAVNKMTSEVRGSHQYNLDQQRLRFASGERLLALKNSRQINLFQNGWLPAAQRIALGVPLHPDHMTRDDWVALPGIGEVLADRIAIDRQKNGEFGTVFTLERVKGIGEKRIEQWVDFF